MMAKMYGMSPEDLGKSFTYGRDQYTIVGLSRKSHKFPLLAKRSDGKVFKFPVDVVSIFFHKKDDNGRMLRF
jgi:hypothetical protein